MEKSSGPTGAFLGQIPRMVSRHLLSGVTDLKDTVTSPRPFPKQGGETKLCGLQNSPPFTLVSTTCSSGRQHSFKFPSRVK